MSITASPPWSAGCCTIPAACRKAARSSCAPSRRERGLDFEFSFLLDSLQVERDQGITVDAAQIWFRTAQRRYVIIDAPGHLEFLRNMVTGASAAEAAVLVVDAKAGVSEQTRRHGYLLGILGVRQVVVAVNKIDLIDNDAGALSGGRRCGARLSGRSRHHPGRHRAAVGAARRQRGAARRGACPGMPARRWSRRWTR